MRNARKQNGTLYLDKNGSRSPVWMFSWRHICPNGKRVRKKRQLGTLDQYKTEAAAERAVRSWRLAINSNQGYAFSGITVNDVIEHFRLKELVDKGENGRAWATRDRYESYLNRWIAPRWGGEELDSIKAPIVEEWLEDLKFDPNWRLKKKSRSSEGNAAKRPKKRAEMQVLSPASKTRIRDLMGVLFNHAIRWGFTDRNPISGPVKGSGVRQSSKRQSIPDILDVSEMQAIIAELQLRERVLLFLDMVTGLRRGELAGLRWSDIDSARWRSMSLVRWWTRLWAAARPKARRNLCPWTSTRHGICKSGIASLHIASPRIGSSPPTAAGLERNAGSSRSGYRPSCVTTSSR